MPKAIILGGYGLIGAACMRALRDAGFDTIGIGRSASASLASDASAEWIIRDIPFINADEWRDILTGVDIVVNASGALQDGGRDDLTGIHVTAIENLTQAAAGLPLRIIQISAVGVRTDASTEFLRSKAKGDAVLSDSPTDWVILRPGLVMAPEAYGGTALLRAIAAMPFILPKALPNSELQTLHITDLTTAVLMAAKGEIATGTIADLVETEAHSLPEITVALRQWLGYPSAKLRPKIPNAALNLTARIADMLGYLGWRSPLRSTSLQVLKDGVSGDPANWIAAGGAPCRPLSDTLRQIHATRQDRIFARAYFALPLAIATLALFWCLSGIITLFVPNTAISVVTDRGIPGWFAAIAVFGGAFADIVLGLAIMWRRWTKPAALGMIILSIAYLCCSLVTAPDLWADPLGPMVKVLPGITLAAFVWLLMEEG